MLVQFNSQGLLISWGVAKFNVHLQIKLSNFVFHVRCTWYVLEEYVKLCVWMIDLCGWQAKKWGLWNCLSFNATCAHSRSPASSEAGWLPLAACGHLGKPVLASHNNKGPQITRFMGPTWGPPGTCRSQMGPMLAPWTLLSGASNAENVSISWLLHVTASFFFLKIIRRQLDVDSRQFVMSLHTPDSKIQGANMGSTWVLSALDGPHVGPVNLAIRDHFKYAKRTENVSNNVLAKLQIHYILKTWIILKTTCRNIFRAFLKRSSKLVQNLKKKCLRNKFGKRYAVEFLKMHVRSQVVLVEY